MSRTEWQFINSNSPRNINTEIPVTIRTFNGNYETEQTKIVQLFNDIFVDSIRKIAEKIKTNMSHLLKLIIIFNKGHVSHMKQKL